MIDTKKLSVSSNWHSDKTISLTKGERAGVSKHRFSESDRDVQPIGPNGSRVGFAAINGAFHALTGVHWALYTLTDWLGLVPIGIAFGFAVLGLVQLIRRKSLLRVDRDILMLGGFYIVVLAAYVLFETVVINYRPVLIGGKLEASYPSEVTRSYVQNSSTRSSTDLWMRILISVCSVSKIGSKSKIGFS